MKSGELRSLFLEFFKARGHHVQRSDFLVPSGDPSLLFTSSGMVQFKPYYLARDKIPFKRAVSCQKCLRTSDIDNVGITARHLTFFEMLGNFSFGDYFKKEAIEYAWEFVTRELRISPERLWISVFETDEEAAGFWRAFVPEDRIVRFGDEDNYWPAGSALNSWVGANGPCSEIYYDHGREKCALGGTCSRPGDHECDRFQEFWNLVFPQFYRNQAGEMTPLPRPGIDTGLGFERLCAILQGKSTNFDTDLFVPLMEKVGEILGTEKSGRDDKEILRAKRIVSDHARAAVFLVGDGIVPTNEGRGYVLRRIIRRAVRQSAIFAEAFPVVSAMVPTVVSLMKDAYPEIGEGEKGIRSAIETEENRFIETLQRGLEELQKEKGSGGKALSGERAFFLYDTFGFPRELTEDIWVREFGRELSPSFERDYEKAMENQQEQSRAAWKGSGSRAAGEILRSMEGEFGATPFVGYSNLRATARVLGMVKTAEGNADGIKGVSARAGETVEVILDRTPFYAEAGGQVADTGKILFQGGAGEVLDVQKPAGGMFVHTVRLTEGKLETGSDVETQVDAERRNAIARHHTATHLLHTALRRIVGPATTQAGSLVAPDRFRFDFMSPKPVSPDQLKAVSEMVNAKVLDNVPVLARDTTIEDARKMGALALFGEKYGERVRLVEVSDYSKELCGGTHVTATGTIGPVVIMSESAVAAGVRRIEGLAGEAALIFMSGQRAAVERIASMLKTSAKELEDRVSRLLEERKTLEDSLRRLKGQLAQKDLAGRMAESEKIGGVSVMISETQAEEPQMLREIADKALDSLGEGVVVIGSRADDKCHLVARVSRGVSNRLSAGDIVKAAARAVGGSGGGKAQMAQAGGKNPAKLPEALAEARKIIAQKLEGKG